MARAGMTTLIQTVRDYAVIGTGDYTLGTLNYWSDDQIQTVLDKHKLTVHREELAPVESYDGGTLVYKEYRSAFGNYEQTTGGTAIFEIEDAVGITIGTASWSMDYANGILTFGSNTTGSAYFLNGTSYDVNRAVASIWRMKAGHHAGGVDFKTDNMSVNRGQLIEHDFDMAEYYDSIGRVNVIGFDRDDTT